MDQHRKINNIAFFGYADLKPEEELYQQVYKAAAVVAQEGYTIVNGGGPGVMEAATRGAESVNGNTLVVTFYPEKATGFEGRYLGNKADKEIVTHNYIERMFTLMENADLYVIFNGGTGTLSELGTAWVLAKLYYGHHKPFILYGDYWHDVITALERNLLIREVEKKVFKIVSNDQELLEAINYFEQEIQSRLPADKGDDEESAFML